MLDLTNYTLTQLQELKTEKRLEKGWDHKSIDVSFIRPISMFFLSFCDPNLSYSFSLFSSEVGKSLFQCI